MTPLLLLRHASAGERSRWQGDDRRRPLDERGRRQAEALPLALAEFSVGRILSSDYLRCVQSVEPLARSLGLEVEPADELAEGADRGAVLGLCAQLDATVAVLCTHGDVIERLLGGDHPCEKGATWVLERTGEVLTPVRYVPPPA